MNDLLKIEMLYGFKCIRPEYAARLSGVMRPGEIIPIDDPKHLPIFMRAPSRPRCDYCGHHVHADGYKCKSCGAPK